MNIVLGKTAGFCFGVLNAVKKVEEQLEDEKNIYCLGELVHNKTVTAELTKKGIIFVNDVNEAKKKIIIRSHGIDKRTYIEAQKKGLEIIDLTCPKVLKIHNIAEEHANKGFYIFLIGQKNHPEIKGTESFCGDRYTLIEDENDVEKALENLSKSNINKLLIIAQTTYSMDIWDSIVADIKSKIDNNIYLEVKKTICDATRLRQEETEKIAKQVEMMIIIGGKHSSNTNKLYEISKKYCPNVIFIANEEELDIKYIKEFNNVGVMAGASTPNNSIEKVIEILKKM